MHYNEVALHAAIGGKRVQLSKECVKSIQMPVEGQDIAVITFSAVDLFDGEKLLIRAPIDDFQLNASREVVAQLLALKEEKAVDITPAHDPVVL